MNVFTVSIFSTFSFFSIGGNDAGVGVLVGVVVVVVDVVVVVGSVVVVVEAVVVAVVEVVVAVVITLGS